MSLGHARILAVSPHLDDAVLSFGAGLTQAARGGAEVTVFTVFAGSVEPPYSPAAERMHTLWGLAPDDDAPLHRRKEDVAALEHLGVAYRHGRFPDSVYRKMSDGRWLTDPAEGRKKLAINPDAPGGDPELVAEIVVDIKALVDEVRPTQLVTCVGIGTHPDHEAARDAALVVARERDIPIVLWEDLPYAMFRSGDVELPAGFQRGAAEHSAIEADVWDRKMQAVKCYATQLLMLHGRDKDLFAQLEDHSRKASPRGGYSETTWPVIRDEDKPEVSE